MLDASDSSSLSWLLILTISIGSPCLADEPAAVEQPVFSRHVMPLFSKLNRVNRVAFRKQIPISKAAPTYGFSHKISEERKYETTLASPSIGTLHNFQ